MKETSPLNESHENRVKRLLMRSMRRGIKEMDILLMGYSKANLATMEEEKLDLYDRLLHENDQDLYQWVTGQVAAPVEFSALVEEISQTYQ